MYIINYIQFPQTRSGAAEGPMTSKSRFVSWFKRICFHGPMLTAHAARPMTRYIGRSAATAFIPSPMSGMITLRTTPQSVVSNNAFKRYLSTRPTYSLSVDKLLKHKETTHEVHNNKAYIQLSPLDIYNRPQLNQTFYLFKEDLDTDRLESSLVRTLAHFPVLCGRYSLCGTRVALTNAGAQWQVAHEELQVAENELHEVDNATDESLPSPDNRNDYFENDISVSTGLWTKLMDEVSTPIIYPVTDVLRLFPLKALGGRQGDPGAPLLRVRVTRLAGGGTAVAVAPRHDVADGSAVALLMVAWARTYSGRGMAEATPSHDRDVGAEADPSLDERTQHTAQLYDPLESLNIHPYNYGIVLPFTQEKLNEMKTDVEASLDHGQSVSKGDVLTARVWRAMTSLRVCDVHACTADVTTTAQRPVNARRLLPRPAPPNAFMSPVVDSSLKLPVHKVLQHSDAWLARRLRQSIKRDATADHVADVIRRLQVQNQRQHHKYQLLQSSHKATLPDNKNLTFSIVSQPYSMNIKKIKFDESACRHVSLVQCDNDVVLSHRRHGGVALNARGTRRQVARLAGVLA